MEASTGSDLNDPNSTPLQQGLVAWYPFDGNASDMSGNGNHGTVNGATLTGDRHGQANRAYSFDGVNDWIDFDSTLLGVELKEMLESFSIEVWVLLDTDSFPDNHVSIISWWSDDSVDQYADCFLGLSRWDYSSSSPSDSLKIRFGDGWNSTEVRNLNTDFWQKITAVKSGGFGEIFLNGKFICRSESSFNSGFNDNAMIGFRAPLANSFSGQIDDVRIYDRALSGEEIRLLYEAEAELPKQSVTSAKLSPALSDLIDGNGSLEQALPAGSVIARKPGETPPPGYTLFQRNEYNASLVWEEKASVSVARDAI